MAAEPVVIRLADDSQVSGLWLAPIRPRAVLLLAHGAGSGMRHPYLASLANGLCAQDIATLRYQFPYMDKGSRRPDPPALCHGTVQAAATAAAAMLAGTNHRGIPVFAGGRSFGGRMTSQAAAAGLLPDVAGLVFLGFPLHPAGKPAVARAAHLARVQIPMLFVQGTRDALAEPTLLKEVLAVLGVRCTLELIDDADHSMHVRRSSGSSDAAVLLRVIDSAARWMRHVAGIAR